MESEGASLEAKEVVQRVKAPVLTVVWLLLERRRIFCDAKSVEFLAPVRVHEKLRFEEQNLEQIRTFLNTTNLISLSDFNKFVFGSRVVVLVWVPLFG
jgi:hypothetical protein